MTWGMRTFTFCARPVEPDRHRGKEITQPAGLRGLIEMLQEEEENA